MDDCSIIFQVVALELQICFQAEMDEKSATNSSEVDNTWALRFHVHSTRDRHRQPRQLWLFPTTMALKKSYREGDDGNRNDASFIWVSRAYIYVRNKWLGRLEKQLRKVNSLTNADCKAPYDVIPNNATAWVVFYAIAASVSRPRKIYPYQENCSVATYRKFSHAAYRLPVNRKCISSCESASWGFKPLFTRWGRKESTNAIRNPTCREYLDV